MAPEPAAAPPDAALLDAWERSVGLDRPWRELALLEVLDGTAPAEATHLPIGERDRRLLALRTRLFGRWIPCEVRCDACDERLELELDGEGLAAGAAPADRTARIAGGRTTVRPPDSGDIAAAMGSGDPVAAILGRCLDPAPTSVSERLRAAAVRRMAELDPWAEIWIEATCPACGSTWTVLLDPASIVVEEVDRRARRVLGEVDQLARAYGWREPDVLALSSARRRAYVGMAAS